MPKKQYNTPHRSYVVKTRMTEEEYANFTERLKRYEMSGAEYGKIGSNLNQIACSLGGWHSPYPQLAAEIRASASDLAARKYEVLEKAGEMNGYIQTYFG